MERDTAEIIVKVWAVLSWLGALLSFAGALFLLFLGGLGGAGMMGGMMGDAFAGGMLGALGVVFGLLALAFGVLYVFVGLGLWQHREWARIATIVLSVLSLFSFPVGTVLGALGIWLFGFDPTVKSLFGAAQASPAPVKSKPAAKKKQ